MRVLLCPSTHGLGHKRRMIVLRDALRMLGHDAQLVQDALPSAPPLDAGRILWDAHEAGSLPAAVDALDARWAADAAAWDAALAHHRPGLVVVDVDPAPAAAARAAGIRAVLVSNFTWADLLDAWGEPDLAARIAERYAQADAYAIPFRLAMRGAARVVPVPHLAWPRERVPGRGRVRVLLAMGRGNPPRMGALVASAPTTLTLPEDAIAPQLAGDIERTTADGDVTYEAARADLVVTKGGYSTVAECIAARVPMVIIPRESPEDREMAQTLAAAGIARIVPAGENVPLPDATATATMRAAYARADPAWATCDPVGAARILLEDSP